MCYNASSSYSSFIFSILLAYVIWMRDNVNVINKNYDYWNVLFMLSYIFVQLGEGMVWQGFDIGKYIILYSVLLQPIMQTFGNAYYNNQPHYYIYVFLGIIFLLLGKISKKIAIGPNHHLQWNILFNTKLVSILFILYYFIFTALPILEQKPRKNFKWLFILYIIALVYSLYSYINSNEWTSMWCFSAIIYSITAYYINLKTD